MVSGRLREYDREQIAKDLIEWAKKPDSINLNKFCCTREPPIAPRKLSEWSHDDDFFKEAYEIAKSFLGARREEWLASEQLHVKAYDLNAAVYDYYLKAEKREQAQFESELKKQEEQKPQQIILKVSNDGLGSGLRVSAEALSTPSDNSPQ